MAIGGLSIARVVEKDLEHDATERSVKEIRATHVFYLPNLGSSRLGQTQPSLAIVANHELGLMGQFQDYRRKSWEVYKENYLGNHYFSPPKIITLTT